MDTNKATKAGRSFSCPTPSASFLHSTMLRHLVHHERVHGRSAAKGMEHVLGARPSKDAPRHAHSVGSYIARLCFGQCPCKCLLPAFRQRKAEVSTNCRVCVSVNNSDKKTCRVFTRAGHSNFDTKFAIAFDAVPSHQRQWYRRTYCVPRRTRHVLRAPKVRSSPCTACRKERPAKASTLTEVERKVYATA